MPTFTKPYTWGYTKTLIQAEVEQNTDTPDTDDSAYWLIIANRLIGDWEEMRKWDELNDYETSGGTLTASTTTYSLDSAVREITGKYVELHRTDGSVEYVPVTDSSNRQYSSVHNERKFYVTGVPGSLVLNTTWAPTSSDASIGATIKFPYYKYATRISSDSSVIEMRDPNYLVDAVVAEVSNQPFKKQLFDGRAKSKMRQMLFNNEEAEDSAIPDEEYGFGI